MGKKYLLCKRDEKGNNILIDSIIVVNREDAIAYLGLCGLANPEETLKRCVDGTGGYVPIKGRLIKEAQQDIV